MGIGILAGLGAGALWGLVFVVPRMLPHLSAVDVAAGRYVAYGVLSLVLLVGANNAAVRPTMRQALAAAVLSVLGFTAYFTWLALSVQLAGTEVPALIIGTVPLWVMLLGKPDHMPWKGVVPGIVLTLAGLVVMTWAVHSPGLGVGLGAGAAPGFWQGVFWVSLATLSWTVFSLGNGRMLNGDQPLDAGVWANWLGVATGMGALVMWGVWGSGWDHVRQTPDVPLTLWVLVVTGVGSGWLATVLWNVACQRLSASLCGQLIVSETLFALLYSYAWDQQWPGVWQVAAALLFVVGILATIKAHA